MDSPNYLAFFFLQYQYTKPTRDKYGLKSQHLQILGTIYHYYTKSPQNKGLKIYLRKMNSAQNQAYIKLSLVDLDRVGLIAYNEQTPTKYTIKLTSEGWTLCEDLFSVESIESFMSSKID